MKNNNNTNKSNEMKTDDGETITYREWLIDRNERLARADKKEAARLYGIKEKEVLAAREKAKKWNPSA